MGYWKSRRWYTKVALIVGGVAVAWTALAVAVAVVVAITDAVESDAAPTTSTQVNEDTTTTVIEEESPPSVDGTARRSQACDLPSDRSRNACQVSYSFCAATATAKVRAYYSGNGASLDVLADRHSKATWGASLSGSFQAGFAGCLAALQDEYDRLYRGG